MGETATSAPRAYERPATEEGPTPAALVPPVDRAHEAPRPDERLDIERIIREVERVVKARGAASGKLRRDAHPKHTALLAARLCVHADVPAHLRWGLLQPGATYPSWVRLSNGEEDDDRKPDARGMSLKVFDPRDLVPIQDFLMIDAPAFFIADARAYVPFVRAQRRGGAWMLLYWLTHLRTALRARRLKRPTVSPFTRQYFSMTPYKLGPHAVKLSMRPHPARADASPAAGRASARDTIALPGHDLVTAMIERYFERHDEMRFQLCVQLRLDRELQPVEDGTVVWREDESPMVPVADLVIPAQEPRSAQRDQLAELASFSPWHTLPEHAPLGSLNRTRREVYRHIARLRGALPQMPPPPLSGE